jgi:hypothetical protein
MQSHNTTIETKQKIKKQIENNKEKKRVMRMIVENAQRNGIEITSDMWQNQIRPLSQEYALKQVENTFYAIRRMNNVKYYSRFLLGFPSAMFNSIKFWVKAGLANPYNFALLEQIRTSPWAAGMVIDEDGNECIRRLSEENKEISDCVKNTLEDVVSENTNTDNEVTNE